MTPIQHRIVDAAHDWRGTPYRHQASLKHVGCDCLGLIRGVWREVIGEEPETPPAYTPDWAESLGEETLMQAARRYLIERPIGETTPGDVLLFRMGLGTPAKHAAIISAPGRNHPRLLGQACLRNPAGSMVVPADRGGVFISGQTQGGLTFGPARSFRSRRLYRPPTRAAGCDLVRSADHRSGDWKLYWLPGWLRRRRLSLRTAL